MSKVRFGDVVKDVKNKVDRNNNPYDFYVAGDHMDTEDLEIHRKGRFDTDDVGPAFIREFKTGQILYGSRRTYLKKVAVADFDGVTANTTFVFETSDENKFLQELLPFVMLSGRFTQWSIMKSKGSTNPYVLFSDLADYEFELPDIEKQRELAKVLWAMDTTKKSYHKLLLKTDELVKAQFIEIFGDPAANPNQWQTMTLQELLDYGWVTYHLDGNHGGEYPKSEEFVLEGVPYISANCIVDGQITFSNAKYVTPERAKRFRKGIAQDEDVLFAHNATVGPVSILHTTEPFIILGTSLTAYRCNKDFLLPAYLKSYMESWAFVEQYESEMQQTTRKQVPITTQRKYKFVVPPIELQGQFSTFVEQSDKSKSELKQALAELIATYKKIISENLE
jgi:type I restriction enzyme S subunit